MTNGSGGVRDEVLARLRQELPLLRERYGLKELILFGSVARGEATSPSDVDVVVDLGAQQSFRKLVAILEHLERTLGRRVDLVTPGAIRPRLQRHIEADGVRVA